MPKIINKKYPKHIQNFLEQRLVQQPLIHELHNFEQLNFFSEN